MIEWLNEPRFLGFSIAQLWIFLSPILAAFFGAVLVHILGGRRSLADHKLTLDYESEVAARQVRREKLLQAYEWIDNAEPSRLDFLKLDPDERFERTKLFAKGMALVKLFGSEALCSKVDEYIEMLNGSRDFNFDDLMNALRDELRHRYGLEPTKSKYKWVDFRKVTMRESGEDK